MFWVLASKRNPCARRVNYVKWWTFAKWVTPERTAGWFHMLFILYRIIILYIYIIQSYFRMVRSRLTMSWDGLEHVETTRNVCCLLASAQKEWVKSWKSQKKLVLEDATLDGWWASSRFPLVMLSFSGREERDSKMVRWTSWVISIWSSSTQLCHRRHVRTSANHDKCI